MVCGGEDWDPIEDVFEDDRARYIHLIRHFLWMGDVDEEKKEEVSADGQAMKEVVVVVDEREKEKVGNGNGKGDAGVIAEKGKGEEGVEQATPGKKKKRGGKKKKKTGSSEVVVMGTNTPGSNAPPSTIGADKAKQAIKKEPAREPDEGMIESKEDIRKRLK